MKTIIDINSIPKIINIILDTANVNINHNNDCIGLPTIKTQKLDTITNKIKLQK